MNEEAKLCIYCRKEISNKNQSIEHIFPQSFGCPDSFTIDCVCADCNNEFGRTIDRVLAGDCLEGIWRLQRIGSKSGKHITQKRIELRVPDEPQYAPFSGAIVFIDFRSKDTLWLPSQILYQDDKGVRKFILVADILKGSVDPATMNYVKSQKYWIFFQDADEQKRALTQLADIGLKFKAEKEGTFPLLAEDKEKGLKIFINGKIDDAVLRSISKIAVNYVAYSFGSSYVLQKTFDQIRDYIRSGIKPVRQLAEVSYGRLLSEETGSVHIFEGHILIIETKNSRLCGKITLSNRYKFFYSVDMGTSILNLKKGIAYCLDEGRMIQLFSPDIIKVIH